MLTLAGIGFCSNTANIWSVVGYFVLIIKIVIPLLLIVLGMIDLGKAVIASKEDEVKKATKAFGKRFLYAVGVFAVVWLVTFVFDTVSSATGGEINPGQANWKTCWDQIRHS